MTKYNSVYDFKDDKKCPNCGSKKISKLLVYTTGYYGHCDKCNANFKQFYKKQEKESDSIIYEDEKSYLKDYQKQEKKNEERKARNREKYRKKKEEEKEKNQRLQEEKERKKQIKAQKKQEEIDKLIEEGLDPEIAEDFLKYKDVKETKPTIEQSDKEKERQASIKSIVIIVIIVFIAINIVTGGSTCSSSGSSSGGKISNSEYEKLGMDDKMFLDQNPQFRSNK